MYRYFRFNNVVLLSTIIFSMYSSQSEAKPARTYASSYTRPQSIPYPKENAFSTSREILGRALFFDPRLSGSNWISCATCHNPAFSWGDGLAKGIGDGMKNLGRRSPTILNLAWGELMFWDGRSASLEEQALGPISSQGEMNLPEKELVGKLQQIGPYTPLFEKAYPGEGISKETIAKALATFERTIVSGTAPFDLWVKGKESAISDSAKRGFVLFNEKALCAQCHSGWRFTDDSFHDIGLAGDDVGRGKEMPDIEVLQHAFKTPTLRNVAIRDPFMHDGSEKTLIDVVEFYNRGGDQKRTSLSEHIKPLQLTTSEKADVISFLKTLTSIDKAVAAPVLPR